MALRWLRRRPVVTGLGALVIAALAATVFGLVSHSTGNSSSAEGVPAAKTPAVLPSTHPTPAARRDPPTSCRSAHRLPPGRSVRTVVSGGMTRTYMLDVPTAGKARRPLPVALSFHGYSQTAPSYEAYTGFGGYTVKRGYLVVTPQGVHNQWNFVRRQAVGPDDVAFVQDLLDDLAHRVCVDPKRIFATGISDGGDMANTIGCALDDRIAAVAPVAASIVPPGCHAPVPSTLEIHGTADRIVPYRGGGGDRSPPFQATVAQPVEARLGDWANLAGCHGTPRWTPVTVSVRFLHWPCPKGRDVGLLSVAAGGHTWPFAAPNPALGPTANEISANVSILLFFAGHARP